MSNEPNFLAAYNPDNITEWLDYVPLRALAVVISEIRTRTPPSAHVANRIQEHPNASSVTKYDLSETLTLQKVMSEIVEEHRNIAHFAITGARYWELCHKQQIKPEYDNNAETGLDFKIHTRNSPEEVILAWQPTPSPIAVLYTMCMGIIDCANRIQQPVQQILTHPDIDKDTLFTGNYGWTFMQQLQAIEENAEMLKRVARTGLVYRKAFFDGKVKFSKENND